MDIPLDGGVDDRDDENDDVQDEEGAGDMDMPLVGTADLLDMYGDMQELQELPQLDEKSLDLHKYCKKVQ